MTHQSVTEAYHDIRVVIIEDDQFIRESYAYLLKDTPGFTVINTYGSYEEAAKTIAEDGPDAILLDIQLPGMSGIDAISKLKQLVNYAQVIMVTVYEDAELIFKALMQGASGYLTKNSSPQKIVEAIKDAIKGGGALSPGVARLVISSFQQSNDTPLTKREAEILQMIADGKSRSAIAKELFIDLETVKTHIKNIYAKLDVHSRADAIKTARDNKFIR